jgi:rod shape-determining protein MreC
MPLGTLDRTPPPFFRQGYSALTKLVFFSALAVFLMVADTRFKVTQPLRTGLAAVLHPLQVALHVPVEIVQGGGDYLRGLSAALKAEDAARAELARQAERTARVEQLEAENARLRSLLELKPGLSVRSMAAEVMYEASDPFSRKVFIDKGATQGVALASPVVNEAGVLGQVTRVYPMSSEVTLVIDKDAAIPVLNPRTQQRSAAFGGAANAPMELRFMASNADVDPGDTLVTSGVDGVYPPGLPVARVLEVTRRAEGGFARVTLVPAANADGVRHVLVLEPMSLQMPPRPEPEPAPGEPPAKSAKAKSKAGARP